MDPDRVPGGRWVHDAMIERGQVNPHHRDLVSAVLMRTALAFVSNAEQGAGVLVEDGLGGAGVDLGVVDVVDRADEGVPLS